MQLNRMSFLTLAEKEIQNIEQLLPQLHYILEHKVDNLSPHAFISFNGLVVLVKLFDAFVSLPSDKAARWNMIFADICLLFDSTLKENQHEQDDDSVFFICSNFLQKLLNTLNHCVTMMVVNRDSYTLPTSCILSTCELAMGRMASAMLRKQLLGEKNEQLYKLFDLLRYTSGITIRMTRYFNFTACRGRGALDLIPKFVQFFLTLYIPSTISFIPDDVIKELQYSCCHGTLSLLFAGLMQMCSSEYNSLPLYTESVFELLLSIAKLDLTTFQEILGAKGLHNQLIPIASLLITHCSIYSERDELLQLILDTIGYFAVCNNYNKRLLQSDLQEPTILQKLINLPYRYYCNQEIKLKILVTIMVTEADVHAVMKQHYVYEEFYAFACTCHSDVSSAILNILHENQNVLKNH